jgi:hypothetical protein
MIGNSGSDARLIVDNGDLRLLVDEGEPLMEETEDPARAGDKESCRLPNMDGKGGKRSAL